MRIVGDVRGRLYEIPILVVGLVWITVIVLDLLAGRWSAVAWLVAIPVGFFGLVFAVIWVGAIRGALPVKRLGRLAVDLESRAEALALARRIAERGTDVYALARSAGFESALGAADPELRRALLRVTERLESTPALRSSARERMEDWTAEEILPLCRLFSNGSVEDRARLFRRGVEVADRKTYSFQALFRLPHRDDDVAVWRPLLEPLLPEIETLEDGPYSARNSVEQLLGRRPR